MFSCFSCIGSDVEVETGRLNGLKQLEDIQAGKVKGELEWRALPAKSATKVAPDGLNAVTKHEAALDSSSSSLPEECHADVSELVHCADGRQACQPLERDLSSHHPSRGPLQEAPEPSCSSRPPSPSVSARSLGGGHGDSGVAAGKRLALGMGCGTAEGGSSSPTPVPQPSAEAAPSPEARSPVAQSSPRGPASASTPGTNVCSGAPRTDGSHRGSHAPVSNASSTPPDSPATSPSRCATPALRVALNSPGSHGGSSRRDCLAGGQERAREVCTGGEAAEAQACSGGSGVPVHMAPSSLSSLEGDNPSGDASPLGEGDSAEDAAGTTSPRSPTADGFVTCVASGGGSPHDCKHHTMCASVAATPEGATTGGESSAGHGGSLSVCTGAAGGDDSAGAQHEPPAAHASQPVGSPASALRPPLVPTAAACTPRSSAQDGEARAGTPQAGSDVTYGASASRTSGAEISYSARPRQSPYGTPMSATTGAAGARANPFVPLYGAGAFGPGTARRTPPPPGAYSSASTRLALHDALSHRSRNRSRVSNMGGSMSVNQLGGNVDFRPRWRY